MIDAIWKIPQAKEEKKGKDWLLNILAKNRGLTTKEKLKEFLNPTLSQITSTRLSDLEKATLRVKKAISAKEKIIVYSDYDADGICATAILWETLNDLGAHVMPHVPHRIKEGYGLSPTSIKKLAKEGASLIITVDHGVTAKKQVEVAKKLGLDVIITDHHLLPGSLPKAHALVHTTKLCGAGVAWCFAWDIIKKLEPSYKEKLIEKLELAAIATIADLVPLLGANRAIVSLGLEKLENTKRPGLKSLFKNSKITGRVGTYQIGHIIAPRINAMGRIEHGLDSLRLLCARSSEQAEKLAQILSKTNTKRQDLTTSAVAHALTLVEEEHLIGVLAHDSWHEGVIGLVASRLVETHNKPMIVISKGQTFSKGSARSVPGFNIVDAIRSASEFLVDAGGHPMAAGFTIETKHIATFVKKINVYASQNLDEKLLNPVINVECILGVEDINWDNLKTIKILEPYGVANPQPTFMTKKMIVEDIRGVGPESRHIKFQLSGLDAIAFNMGERKAQIRPGDFLDVVYTLEENQFNGSSTLQLKLKDFELAN